MASENNHWYVGTNPDTMGAKSQTGKGSENKDPLPYDVKIKAMEALWPDVANHIVPEESIMTLASKVYREHGEGVNLVAYTDEAWILKLLTEYNNKEAKHGYYNFANITTKPTPRLSSATDVRNAVKADDREAFERAAGVPADYKIDGKNYFDLVAGYLLPQEEGKSDKYLQQKNIEESKMDIARLRKLSGIPAVLNEGAPVDFGDKIKPAHGMTDNERKLADIGRLLMDRAKEESDDAVSNAMAQLGDRLATGSITDQSDLVDFVKSSTADPATLSDSVTKTFAAYGAGERADMSKVDDRRKGSARPDEEEPEMDDDAAMSAIDDMDTLEDSVDLDDIRAEYEGNEFTGELNKAKEEDEDEFEVDGKTYKVKEGENCDCCDSDPCACGPECPTCGGMDENVEEGRPPKHVPNFYGKPPKSIKDMARKPEPEELSDKEKKQYDDIARRMKASKRAEMRGEVPTYEREAVEETADNAMAAAMAELRKLAGL